jgi:hypothetical protein
MSTTNGLAGGKYSTAYTVEEMSSRMFQKIVGEQEVELYSVAYTTVREECVGQIIQR